jgi:hypothetical protein
LHAALADHAANAVIADDLPLIGFLARARGGAGRDDLPCALLVFDDDRSAMVDHAAAQADAFGQGPAFVEVFVDGVAAGEHDALKVDFIANLEGSDGFLGERG